MRYDDEHGFVSLDGAELRGGAAAATLGALAPAPLAGGSAADREAWQKGLADLTGVARERAEKALARLVAPARVVELHTTSELGPHHLYFAWGQGGAGRLALLGVSQRGYSLALRTASDLVASLHGALGLAAQLVGADTRTALDAPAALALAAFLDVLRANRLLSELQHRLPLETASAADVTARLADARVDDPRWPLNTLQQVLPLDLAASAQQAGIPAALGRLVAAGLLESAEASGALPALFSPAVALRPLVEENDRAVGHVALSVFQLGPDRTPVFESALLLRGPLSLWLLSVAPPAASLASLSAAGAAQLLVRLAPSAAPPLPEPGPAPTVLLPRVTGSRA
jgi:hypothetical protein